MSKPDTNRVRESHQSFDLRGAHVPGASLAGASKAHRLKVFKSGNSLALRLPKALGLEAGMELELEMLPSGAMALHKVEPAKRKFDIDKVWGSASSLKPIDPEDRWFTERKLDWSNASGKDQV
jgi:antitoxin VapB